MQARVFWQLQECESAPRRKLLASAHALPHRLTLPSRNLLQDCGAWFNPAVLASCTTISMSACTIFVRHMRSANIYIENFSLEISALV